MAKMVLVELSVKLPDGRSSYHSASTDDGGLEVVRDLNKVLVEAVVKDLGKQGSTT